VSDDRTTPDEPTSDRPLPPPYGPDPELVDHAENNGRMIRRLRRSARRHSEEAQRRYDAEVARRRR
jgi:hypothetical protein